MGISWAPDMDTRQRPQGLLSHSACCVQHLSLIRKGQEGDWTQRPAGRGPGRAWMPEERPHFLSMRGWPQALLLPRVALELSPHTQTCGFRPSGGDEARGADDL